MQHIALWDCWLKVVSMPWAKTVLIRMSIKLIWLLHLKNVTFLWSTLLSHTKLQVYFTGYCSSLVRVTHFSICLCMFLFSVTLCSFISSIYSQTVFPQSCQVLQLWLSVHVHFERTLVFAYNNNPVPKRQTLRAATVTPAVLQQSFGFGTSSTAVMRLKVYPWRAKARILAC